MTRCLDVIEDNCDTHDTPLFVISHGRELSFYSIQPHTHTDIVEWPAGYLYFAKNSLIGKLTITPIAETKSTSVCDFL